MALGIKMMAHGPVPHGSVQTDRPQADHLISPCFFPVCSLPVWGNITDHPFYHSQNARRSFPACLKCAETSWLEWQTSGRKRGCVSAVWYCEGSLPFPWDKLWEALT